MAPPHETSKSGHLPSPTNVGSADGSLAFFRHALQVHVLPTPRQGYGRMHTIALLGAGFPVQMCRCRRRRLCPTCRQSYWQLGGNPARFPGRPDRGFLHNGLGGQADSRRGYLVAATTDALSTTAS